MEASAQQVKLTGVKDQNETELDYKQELDKFIFIQSNTQDYYEFKKTFWNFIQSNQKTKLTLSNDWICLIDNFCNLCIQKNQYPEISEYFLNLIDNNKISEYAKSEYIQYALGLINWDEIGVENPTTTLRENNHKKTDKHIKEQLLNLLHPGRNKKHYSEELKKFNPETSLTNKYTYANSEAISNLLSYYKKHGTILLIKQEIDEFKTKYGKEFAFLALKRKILVEVYKYLSGRNYSIRQACHKINELCKEGIMTGGKDYSEMYNFVLDITKGSQRRGLDLDQKEKGIVLQYLFDLGKWDKMEEWLKFLEQIKIDALKPESNQH